MLNLLCNPLHQGMLRRTFFLPALALAAALYAVPVWAVDTAALAKNLPGKEQMEKLEAQMKENPKNLDNFFAYGQMTAQLGELDKSAKAYEHMLKADPSLNRVKLDLSVVYSRMGRYDESKALLKEVLAREDVPEQVKNNIETVLKQVEEASKEHFVDGSIMAGINQDSNGNSVASSGRITIQDTEIPLDATQRAQSDYQALVIGTVNHRWRKPTPLAKDAFGAPATLNWKSSVSAFQNEQEHLDQLNIKLLSLRTGPSFELPGIMTKIDLTPSYTIVVLDGHSYLKIYSGEISAEHAMANGVRLQAAFAEEYREFINSPTVNTYTDRSGYAQQAKFGAMYALTQTDFVDANIQARWEDTKRTYFDNHQLGPTLGYTRQWDLGIFSRLQLGYKNSVYDGPDPLISQKIREDREKSFSTTVGKNFENGMSLMLSYQYRDVDSNIKNYEYDNHRLSAMTGWRF